MARMEKDCNLISLDLIFKVVFLSLWFDLALLEFTLHLFYWLKQTFLHVGRYLLVGLAGLQLKFKQILMKFKKPL